MTADWALHIGAIAVVLAVLVPLVILAPFRSRRPRAPRLVRHAAVRPFVAPADWLDADLWTTGVHTMPPSLDPRLCGRVHSHRRRR